MRRFAGLPTADRRVVCVQEAVHTIQTVGAPRMRSYVQRPQAERQRLSQPERVQEHVFRAPVLLSYVPGQRTLIYQTQSQRRVETRLFDAPRQKWRA